MTKTRVWHYLKLALEAIFLLNFSAICIFCFVYVFGPIITGGGFFQGFIWSMMINEVSTSPVIIALRILLFLSSVYFWFKKQNWLTAAYLIIAGTGAGILGVYFFAFYYLSFLGCLAVLAFCFCFSLFLKFLARLAKNAKINACVRVWKKFWTPAKIGIACVICAIILAERFSPWEFPVFGKALPYVVVGHNWSGRIPPYETGVTIAVDVAKTNASPADMAATCAAAARYFSENYGLPAIRVSMYDYIAEIHKMDQCYVELGHCRYAPTGWHLYDDDKDLKPGWSHFEVTRDIPVKTIRECNKVITNADLPDLETEIIKKMGYWNYRKLNPGDIKVEYGLLAKDLCEKPASDAKDWSFSIARNKLVEECESLFYELKEIGGKPDFPLCHERGCQDRAYNAWVRRKYLLANAREGNFVPEINAYNRILDAFARACAEKDEEKMTALTIKMEKILAELKAFKVCGKE